MIDPDLQPSTKRTEAEIEAAASDCFHACFKADDLEHCAAIYGANLIQFRGWSTEDAVEMVITALKLLDAPPPKTKPRQTNALP